MKKSRIAYIDNEHEYIQKFREKSDDYFETVVFEDGSTFLNWIEEGNSVNAVVARKSEDQKSISHLKNQLNAHLDLVEKPFVVLSENLNIKLKREALSIGISDLFDPDFDREAFLYRMQYLIDNAYAKKLGKVSKWSSLYRRRYKTPPGKRLFDIFVASFALVILTPFFLLLAVLIKIESKGSVFYISKRVGSGLKVFDFYKFRSMSSDADKKLAEMKSENQYTDEYGHEVLNGNPVSNNEILRRKKLNGNTFHKFKNDSRVTKVGKFLRKYSIDELPQLLNVLKGDMSIVGNRPLPVYEAERITTDQFVVRFMAPSGLTGLWQVEKRGKGNMSEQERIELDIKYAKKYSFKMDLRIMMRTFTAFIQDENV